ncbi:MAG: lipoyl protein ligase domain-containing protein, partial [Verrucomicrobiales bacterium]
MWRDAVARSGPENMAIDRWLMDEVAEGPVLRLYGWAGDWVSYGYFQQEEEARAIFGPELSYVRRWTGGGLVDHRVGATYTLAMSRTEPVARLGKDGSYRAIHEAVAACLRAGGGVGTG